MGTEIPTRNTMSTSHVLVVDDDPSLLEAMTGTLKIRLGHFTLDTCQIGSMALGHIRTKRYDAVITDLNMPKMDGLQLLRAVKQIRPYTPVVLISGYANQTVIAQALQEGAADFIAKPIDREAFLRSVRQALNISRLRQLLTHQEALLNRTSDQYLDVVEKVTLLNEQRLISVKDTITLESNSITSSTIAPHRTSDEQGRGHTSRVNRHLAKLDALREKVVQAHREASALLRAGEEQMRRYAMLRLERRQ